MSSNRIVQLSNSIQENTAKFDAFFSSHGIPTPSFGVETPLELEFPNDIKSCRSTILEATDELHTLVLGPTQTVNWLRVIEHQICIAFASQTC